MFFWCNKTNICDQNLLLLSTDSMSLITNLHPHLVPWFSQILDLMQFNFRKIFHFSILVKSPHSGPWIKCLWLLSLCLPVWARSVLIIHISWRCSIPICFPCPWYNTRHRRARYQGSCSSCDLPDHCRDTSNQCESVHEGTVRSTSGTFYQFLLPGGDHGSPSVAHHSSLSQDHYT